MSHCAIIAARRGSKSIKNKNLLKLNNKTLIRIAVEKAMESGIFSRVILNTDYQMHEMGLDGIKSTRFCEFRYMIRPQNLCGDEIEMIQVVQHTLKNCGGDDKWIWLFQPTSPFRTKQEIITIKNAMEGNQYKSAISWKAQKEVIDRTATWRNGRAYRINQNNFKNKQDLQKQVHRSGNYYVIERSIVEAYKDEPEKFCWMQEPSYSYVMGEVDPEKMSIENFLRSRMLGTNIDDIQDYAEAKLHVSHGDVKV